MSDQNAVTKEDYKAEVKTVAEGVVYNLKNFHPKGKWNDALPTIIDDAIDQHTWVIDEDLQISVLRFSKNPSYGIFHGTGPVNSKDISSPGDDFPFAGFASCAMNQDVTEKVGELLAEEGINLQEEQYCTNKDYDEDEDEEYSEDYDMSDMRFVCPNCGKTWEETDYSVSDSECPSCETEDITVFQHKLEDDDWSDSQNSLWVAVGGKVESD